MSGNMYNWAFPTEQIQAINAAHEAEVAAAHRAALALGRDGQAPRLGHMARLIRAWLRSLRAVPRQRLGS